MTIIVAKKFFEKRNDELFSYYLVGADHGFCQGSSASAGVLNSDSIDNHEKIKKCNDNLVVGYAGLSKGGQAFLNLCQKNLSFDSIDFSSYDKALSSFKNKISQLLLESYKVYDDFHEEEKRLLNGELAPAHFMFVCSQGIFILWSETKYTFHKNSASIGSGVAHDLETLNSKNDIEFINNLLLIEEKCSSVAFRDKQPTVHKISAK